MIDLYSDTKTQPTAAMRAAMAAAHVGDEQADEDPTTLELCRRVARLLGLEAGVFMPSGTMCNLVATLCHTRPGDELLCGADSHVAGTEAASAAVVGGVQLRLLPGRGGRFDADAVRAALRPPGRTAPRSALLVAEQTTFAGGGVWPLDALRGVRDAARAAGLRTHIDGARLLNACAALGVPAADVVDGWDSAWLDLSKGLGCPVGAVLCGSAAFVRDAWQWKYRLGGAMRQSGVLAAAGLHALEHHVERLGDDHAHALLIWESLSHDARLAFPYGAPESNLLRVDLADGLDATAVAGRCLAAGVRVRTLGGQALRLTTHLDITRADAARAAQALAAALDQAG